MALKDVVYNFNRSEFKTRSKWSQFPAAFHFHITFKLHDVKTSVVGEKNIVHIVASDSDIENAQHTPWVVKKEYNNSNLHFLLCDAFAGNA